MRIAPVGIATPPAGGLAGLVDRRGTEQELCELWGR